MKENETKKYVLTSQRKTIHGVKLRRIKALISFSDVKAGDLGGFVESEENLSHEGNCWIYDESKVYGNAKVTNNAIMKGKSLANNNAKITNNAIVIGSMDVERVSTYITDNAVISGNAKVSTVHGIIGGSAIITNDVEVNCYSCYIGNHTILMGNSKIVNTNENSRIVIQERCEFLRNAYITKENDFLVINNINFEMCPRKQLLCYLNEDKEVLIQFSSCNIKTLAEFEEFYQKFHYSDTPNFYNTIINLIKFHFRQIET